MEMADEPPTEFTRRFSWQMSGSTRSRHGSRFGSNAVQTPEKLSLELAKLPSLQDKKFDEGSHMTAFVACLVVAIGSFTTGTVFGYSSPSTPNINSHRNPFHMDKEQTSWEGSIITLGGLVGGLIGGPLMDKFGRKLVCMTVPVPFIIGWLIIVSSGSFGCLLSGRFLTGACTGILLLVCPVYIAEVAPASIRGILGSLHQFAITVGILFSYSLGAFMSWTWLAIACGTILPVWMALLSFVPETPRWLMATDCKKGARQALEILRGDDCDVEEELLQIETMILASQDKASIREFRQPQLLKPLLITLGLMALQQTTGINVVMFYTVDIFKAANASINPHLESIIVGAIGVIGTIVSVTISDKVGRRILLLVSGTLCTISMTGLGTYFFLTYKGNDTATTDLFWLPVVCLVLFNFGFNVAFGPIPWVMMGELFPIRAKGVASGMATVVNRLVAFLVTKFFTDVTEHIHLYGGFWLCAAFSAITIPFVLLFVPETKGKTLEEIEKHFIGRTKESSELNQMNGIKKTSIDKV